MVAGCCASRMRLRFVVIEIKHREVEDISRYGRRAPALLVRNILARYKLYIDSTRRPESILFRFKTGALGRRSVTPHHFRSEALSHQKLLLDQSHSILHLNTASSCLEKVR
jgi:hypothetical protein